MSSRGINFWDERENKKLSFTLSAGGKRVCVEKRMLEVWKDVGKNCLREN